MADVAPGDESSRRRLLWDLSSERRVQARHSETLRSSVAAYVLTAASGLIAVITFDEEVNRYDFPLAILLVAIGVLGMLFSATYTERYHRNRNRASKLLRELDSAVSAGSARSTFQIEDEADKEHLNKRRFSVARNLASSHWLWLAFPLLVAIVGAVLVGECLRNWHLPPSPRSKLRQAIEKPMATNCSPPSAPTGMNGLPADPGLAMGPHEQSEEGWARSGPARRRLQTACSEKRGESAGATSHATPQKATLGAWQAVVSE